MHPLVAKILNDYYRIRVSLSNLYSDGKIELAERSAILERVERKMDRLVKGWRPVYSKIVKGGKI